MGGPVWRQGEREVVALWLGSGCTKARDSSLPSFLLFFFIFFKSRDFLNSNHHFLTERERQDGGVKRVEENGGV